MKKENTALEAKKNQVPAVYDYSQYENQGFEAHTREDYATPFLGILQPLSPLCETNPDARPGMLINTVTQKLYDGKEGVVFIPAATDHVFVEWKPRDQGGGFVGIHQLNSEIVRKAKSEQEFGKYKSIKGDPKSNDLMETYYVYGILIGEGGAPEQMIIAFTSTKIAIYKQWMTIARTIQITLPNGRRIAPPLFAHKYRLTTAAEKNQKGSFFNFRAALDGKRAEDCRLAPDDYLFQAAVAFHDLMKEGRVKAAYDSQPEAAAEPEEEIPFE